MIAGFMIVAALAAQAQPVASSPPETITLRGISAERSVAAFMEDCFRPKWQIAKMREAASGSDFGYVETTLLPDRQSFRWDSKRGGLALDTLIRKDSEINAQCELTVGSIQPRTDRQLLAMLKPAVEIELQHSVRSNDVEVSLEWDDPDPRYFDRIYLAEPKDKPSQSVWYIFDQVRKRPADASHE